MGLSKNIDRTSIAEIPCAEEQSKSKRRRKRANSYQPGTRNTAANQFGADNHSPGRAPTEQSFQSAWTLHPHGQRAEYRCADGDSK